MKLKHLVVASMSALGLVLVSGPAFAADTAAAAPAADATATAAPAPVKHKHHHYHHRMHHHAVAASKVNADSHPDYKGMGAMPAPVVEACSANSKFDGELSIINQQTGRAWANNCDKPVALAGGLTADGKWGNRTLRFIGTNTRAISVNDAYLNVSGKASDWATVYASLEYGNPNEGYSYSYTHEGDNKVTLEQIYGRIANFDVAPVYVQVGKQFIDNGRYNTHAPVRSFTQVLTETLRTAAQVGVITAAGNGVFHADVSAFDGGLRSRSTSEGTGTNASSKHDTIYGAAIGYDMPATNDAVGLNANLSYLSDITGANDVEEAVRSYRILNTTEGKSTASRHGRTGEIAADVSLTTGPFSFGVDYAKALTSLDVKDLPTVNKYGEDSKKAEPWAAGLQAGYHFNAVGKDQTVTLGYQKSGDAPMIGLPEHRWIVAYDIAAFKGVDLGLQINRDTDYNIDGNETGWNGKSSFNIGVSAGFQFGGANSANA